MSRPRPPAAVLGSLVLALVAAGLTACSVPTVCTLEFGVEVTPTVRSLAVGQEFTANATGVSCGGRSRSEYTVRWESTAPAVASVDSITGRVRALAPGTATIEAREPAPEGSVWGGVRVTVTP
jgi:uncharacterized protein YjdB